MNDYDKGRDSLWTAPNLLTCFRFVSAPFLLALAWTGHGVGFLVLLAVTLATDALDGLVARLTGQISPLGAKLDSWADMIIYITIAVSCWWLWPEIVRQEALYVWLVVFSYLLPPAVGLIKFGAFTSYHTWAVKLAAASVGLSLYVLFLGGSPWPFRIAAFLCVAAAIEEIAITLTSPRMYYNVGSFWDVQSRIRREREQEAIRN